MEIQPSTVRPKGQIAAHLARQSEHTVNVFVRVGGPNAGHTITDVSGIERKLQQIPCGAFVRPGSVAVIGVSGLIIPDVLKRELEWLDQCYDAIGCVEQKPVAIVDRMCGVILPKHLNAEEGMNKRLGSTKEGVGAATSDRVMRTAIIWGEYMEALREEDPELYEFLISRIIISNSQRVLTNYIEKSPSLMVQLEGTQGYLLSLNVSRFYPFCTSRDVGPEAIMGQVGVTPRAFDDARMICVMRNNPIRVAGNSGPLPNETSWEELRERSGGYIQPEQTTVTKKIRRVAYWSDEVAMRAIRETNPTEIAFTFLDYEFPSLATDAEPGFGEGVIAYIREKEEAMGVPITMAAYGPGMIADISKTSSYEFPSPEVFMAYVDRVMAAIQADDTLAGMNTPAGIKEQVQQAGEAVKAVLAERGEQYGEDVIFTTGDDGLVIFAVHKALRLLWMTQNDDCYTVRRDSWLDLAGYAILSMAMDLWRQEHS